MSTVIWVRVKKANEVVSNEVDYFWTYKHWPTLDKVCKKIGVTPLSTFLDHTDATANLMDDLDNDALEAFVNENESWFDIHEGTTALSKILAHLEHTVVKFGLLKCTPQEEVMSELHEIHSYLKGNMIDNAKFHLCVLA